MKKILLLFLSPFICFNFIFAQGFLWDSTSQRKFDQLELLETDTRSILPSRYSLEKYTPDVLDQGKTPMCVSYALSSARTILYAKNKRITKNSKIDKSRFSPFYLSYTVSGTCEEGMNPDAGLDCILYNGIAQMKNVEGKDYYPNGSIRLCNNYPSNYNKDKKQAKKFKIDSYKKVLTISQIKSSISSGNPCLYGIYTVESFDDIDEDLWEPKRRESPRKHNGLHALIVIGYDDNKHGGSFRILNSWGTDWGDNGKIWIRYDDFMDYMIAAYSVSRRYD
jgi:C1A family cysteine protease